MVLMFLLLSTGLAKTLCDLAQSDSSEFVTEGLAYGQAMYLMTVQ